MRDSCINRLPRPGTSSGNPSHAGIPKWTAWDPNQRATMVFGAGAAKLVADPGKNERLALKALAEKKS